MRDDKADLRFLAKVQFEEVLTLCICCCVFRAGSAADKASIRQTEHHSGKQEGKERTCRRRQSNIRPNHRRNDCSLSAPGKKE